MLRARFLDEELFEILGNLEPVGYQKCSWSQWERAHEYLNDAEGRIEDPKDLTAGACRLLVRVGHLDKSRREKATAQIHDWKT